MATASETIIGAYRELNLRAAGQALTSVQETEGLELLNEIIPATIGQEAGQELCDLNIGGEYDDDIIWEWVPENVRLVINAGAQSTLKLHPKPYDGQRVAVSDPNNVLASANLTLDGNGRSIEGAATLVLSTDGLDAEWMYRADLGNWVRITSLVAGDELPFPRDFDAYFRILLAMRLAPRHGRELAQSSAVYLQSMEGKIQARYRRPRDQQDWGSLGLLGQRQTFLDGQFARWRGF